MAKLAFTDTEIYLIHEIVIRLDRIARSQILVPLGITYPEFLVMMAVRETNAPNQEAVGGHIDLSSSLVSQRVSALRKKGLVAQTQNEENRREVLLELTEKGNAVLDSAYRAMVSSSEALFDVTGSDRPALHRSLRSIAQALRGHEAGSRPG